MVVMLLTALMLALLTACSEPAGPSQSESSEASAQESEAMTVKEYVRSIADGKYYEDTTFTIVSVATFNTEYMPMYFEVSEYNDEPFNDAAYERNLLLEELLGVQVVFSGAGNSGTELPDMVKNAINSNTHEYDLIVPHSYYGVVSLMTDGMLYDWYDVPFVDFTKDWWLESALDDLSVAGKTVWAVGDLTIGYQTPAWMLFNRDMAEEYGKEELYRTVLDGNWTLDVMCEYVKDVSSASGEGEKVGAQFPEALLKAFMNSTNTYPSGKDSSGALAFEPSVSRISELCTKLSTIVTGGDAEVVPYDSEKYTDFINGKTLMLLFNGGHYETMRNIDFNVGIVPLPKLDENQDDYISLGGGGIMAIPIDTPDIEFAGLVTQALNALSSDSVRPAFYETVLYNKCLKDDDSQKMMDIILETQQYVNVVNVSEIEALIPTVYKDGAVQSYIDKYSQSIKSQYADITSGVIESNK